MRATYNLFWVLASLSAAQTVQPSNISSELPDVASSPRFDINATYDGPVKFPGFVIAPLGRYANTDHATFVALSWPGVLVKTDASNAKDLEDHDFNYVSCDPEDYEDGNISVNNILQVVANQPMASTKGATSLIFYSTRSNHCNASGINGLPRINGIFTTVDPTVAAQVANLSLTRASNAKATLTPDLNSYTSGQQSSGSGYAQPPTTAIAMIILYSITGIITALFIVIIVTGAIRAHRHPERYGPRNGPGRQSRAKGIARAMLETLPIVKFGDNHNVVKDKARGDVELATNAQSESTRASKPGEKSVVTTETAEAGPSSAPDAANSGDAINRAAKPDGSDETGTLGCSICTEDFHKGEEVRVLPCNHKFHPECVDPWLLNISGTCPLCRIDLASQGGSGTPDADGNMPPPVLSNTNAGDRRSQALNSLMAIAYGSREERMAGLRRYRAERRNRGQSISEDERVSRARRFREALRIRTRTHEPNEVEVQMRDSGLAAISGGQMRF